MAQPVQAPSPELTREGKNYADGCSCLGLIGFNKSFWAAVEEGDHELVATLLAEDLTLLKQTKPSEGRLSAWHLAAKSGHINVLQTLKDAVLSCGEDSTKLDSSLRRMFAITRSGEDLLHEFVNWTTFTNQTPLMLACRNGHKEAALLLLSSGANPWMGDAEGLTALHYAARHNCWEVIRELLQHPPPYSRVATRLNRSTRKYIDVLDVYGYTPLHHAAAERKLDAVATLLAHGADMISRTWFQSGFYPQFPRGMTALHIAAWRGDLPIAKHIVKTHFESNGNLLPAQTSPTEQQQRARERPDPRRILTQNSLIPYHIAGRMSRLELLDLLDPAVPLMFLSFVDEEGEAGMAGMAVGVPRLALIASKVLHEELVNQLAAAEQLLEEHAAKQQQLQQQQLAEAAHMQQKQREQQQQQQQQQQEEEEKALEKEKASSQPRHLVAGKGGHGIHGGLKIKRRHWRLLSLISNELQRFSPQAVLSRRDKEGQEGGAVCEEEAEGHNSADSCSEVEEDGSKPEGQGSFSAGAGAARPRPGSFTPTPGTPEGDGSHGGRDTGTHTHHHYTNKRTRQDAALGLLLQHQGMDVHQGVGLPSPSRRRVSSHHHPYHHLYHHHPTSRKLKKLHALAQAQTQAARGYRSQQPPAQPSPPAPLPRPFTRHGHQRSRSFTAVRTSPLHALLQGVGVTRLSGRGIDELDDWLPAVAERQTSDCSGLGQDLAAQPPEEAFQGAHHLHPGWQQQRHQQRQEQQQQQGQASPSHIPRIASGALMSYSNDRNTSSSFSSSADHSSAGQHQHFLLSSSQNAQEDGEGEGSVRRRRGGRKGGGDVGGHMSSLFGNGSLFRRLAKTMAMQRSKKVGLLRADARPGKHNKSQHDRSHHSSLARESMDAFNRAALLQMGMYAPLNVDSNPVAQLRFPGPDIPLDPRSLRAALPYSPLRPPPPAPPPPPFAAASAAAAESKPSATATAAARAAPSAIGGDAAACPVNGHHSLEQSGPGADAAAANSFPVEPDATAALQPTSASLSKEGSKPSSVTLPPLGPSHRSGYKEGMHVSVSPRPSGGDLQEGSPQLEVQTGAGAVGGEGWQGSDAEEESAPAKGASGAHGGAGIEDSARNRVSKDAEFRPPARLHLRETNDSAEEDPAHLQRVSKAALERLSSGGFGVGGMMVHSPCGSVIEHSGVEQVGLFELLQSGSIPPELLSSREDFSIPVAADRLKREGSDGSIASVLPLAKAVAAAHASGSGSGQHGELQANNNADKAAPLPPLMPLPSRSSQPITSQALPLPALPSLPSSPSAKAAGADNGSQSAREGRKTDTLNTVPSPSAASITINTTRSQSAEQGALEQLCSNPMSPLPFSVAAAAAAAAGAGSQKKGAWGEQQEHPRSLLGPLRPCITEVAEEGEEGQQEEVHTAGEELRSSLQASCDSESWPEGGHVGRIGRWEARFKGLAAGHGRRGGGGMGRGRRRQQEALGIFRISEGGGGGGGDSNHPEQVPPGGQQGGSEEDWRQAPSTAQSLAAVSSQYTSSPFQRRSVPERHSPAPSHHPQWHQQQGRPGGEQVHRRALSLGSACEGPLPLEVLTENHPAPPPSKSAKPPQRSSSMGTLSRAATTGAALHLALPNASHYPTVATPRLAVISEQEHQGRVWYEARPQSGGSLGGSMGGGESESSKGSVGAGGGGGGGGGARRRRPLSTKRVPPLLLAKLQRQLNRRSNQVSPGHLPASPQVHTPNTHTAQGGGGGSGALARRSQEQGLAKCSRASAERPISGGSHGSTRAGTAFWGGGGSGAGSEAGDSTTHADAGTGDAFMAGDKAAQEVKGEEGAKPPSSVPSAPHVTRSASLHNPSNTSASEARTSLAQHGTASSCTLGQQQQQQQQQQQRQHEVQGGAGQALQAPAASVPAGAHEEAPILDVFPAPAPPSIAPQSSVCLADEEDDMCPVCLDAPPNIQVMHCRHVLCAPCAKDLCMRHSLAPALCPYCRIVISGFKPIIS